MTANAALKVETEINFISHALEIIYFKVNFPLVLTSEILCYQIYSSNLVFIVFQDITVTTFRMWAMVICDFEVCKTDKSPKGVLLWHTRDDVKFGYHIIGLGELLRGFKLPFLSLKRGQHGYSNGARRFHEMHLDFRLPSYFMNPDSFKRTPFAWTQSHFL